MERPLVFLADCPTVILPREQAMPLKRACVARRFVFQADPFFTFERLRFPGRTTEDVEALFDRLEQAERISEVAVGVGR